MPALPFWSKKDKKLIPTVELQLVSLQSEFILLTLFALGLRSPTGKGKEREKYTSNVPIEFFPLKHGFIRHVLVHWAAQPLFKTGSWWLMARDVYICTSKAWRKSRSSVQSNLNPRCGARTSLCWLATLLHKYKLGKCQTIKIIFFLWANG